MADAVVEAWPVMEEGEVAMAAKVAEVGTRAERGGGKVRFLTEIERMRLRRRWGKA